jgi:hypothetical protein
MPTSKHLETINDIPDIDDTNLAIKQILESHQLLVKQ